MSMSAGGSKGINSDINVTPLVDVVLVLLIIFMVVTPMLQRGYDLDVPQAVEQVIPPDMLQKQLIVTYTPEGDLYINKDKTTVVQFEAKLTGILAGQSKKLVFLAAARNLPYGDVVGLMDTIRAAGAENIGLVTEDKLAVAPVTSEVLTPIPAEPGPAAVGASP